MDLILTRKECRSDGIFSQLTDLSGNFICETLEHAYPDEDGVFHAKIPAGKYQCQRGNHMLHGMDTPFETFEITEVPGHSKLLFHWGNFQKDSEGCVLVGALMANSGGIQMITRSRDTFVRFMYLQKDSDSFELTVIDG